MADFDDNSSLFNHIMGDMKLMIPLWEDLILKATKFYSAVKQTSITADAFLDSFQKIADAATHSKGATSDIGVLFTKTVMRHRSIENKLKRYVGILADTFISPMHHSIDEWKKNCTQIEKDHAKDYKKVKVELKKTCADAAKSRKKSFKKLGRYDYAEQFHESMKVSNHLSKVLEEQEKTYLRKLMIEERAQCAQFFQHYKPCLEQEISLILDIDQLQSILEETSEECASLYIPLESEEAIKTYKVPDSLTINLRECPSSFSPPSSPPAASFSPPSSPSANDPLYMNINYASPSSDNSFFRRFQTFSEPYDRKVLDAAATTSAHNDSGVSSDSLPSSSSSADPTTIASSSYDAPYEDSEPCHSSPINTSLQAGNQVNCRGYRRTMKPNTSCSSIDASMSSGSGSYKSSSPQNLSLNAFQYPNFNRNGSDTIDTDFDREYENINLRANMALPDFQQPGEQEAKKYATIDRSHFRRNTIETIVPPGERISKKRSNSIGGHESDFFRAIPDCKINLSTTRINYSPDDASLHTNLPRSRENDTQKFATIDRSHFRRNHPIAASLKEMELNRRPSNTDGDTQPSYPEFPEYKMNLPKSKVHSVGKHNMYTSATRPTIFQIFDDQNTSSNVPEVFKRFDRVQTPKKQTSDGNFLHERRGSLPPPPTMKKCYSRGRQVSLPDNVYSPKAHTEENDPPPAKPGSFEASLQERRYHILNKNSNYSHF